MSSVEVGDVVAGGLLAPRAHSGTIIANLLFVPPGPTQEHLKYGLGVVEARLARSEVRDSALLGFRAKPVDRNAKPSSELRDSE